MGIYIKKTIINALRTNKLIQALLLATIVVLPLAVYTVPAHRVLAPLNVLSECCGWDYVPQKWSPYNLQISDTVDYILPMKFYTYESLQAGTFPFWNPYFFGGGEFFSNSQSAVLHPLNLLYLFAGPLASHTLSVLLSIYVMIASSYLLLRRLSLGAWPAVVGALGYATIPWVIFWLEWGTIGWIMAFWPAILYFLYRFRESSYRSAIDITLATALIGIQFYFGHLQFSLFTLGIVLSWWLVSWLVDSRQRLRIAVLGASTLVIALLLGSLTLVNTINMSLVGHRSGMQAVGWGALIKSDIAPQFKALALQTDALFYVPTTAQVEVIRILFVIGIGFLVWAAYQKRYKEVFMKHGIVLFALLWIFGIGFAFSLPGFRHILGALPVGKGMLHHYFIAIAVMATPFLAAFSFEKLLLATAKHHLIVRGGGLSWVLYLLYAVCIASVGVAIHGVVTFYNNRTDITGMGWLVLLPLFAGVIVVLLERRVDNRKLAIPMVATAGIMIIQYWGSLYAYLPMPENYVYLAGNSSYSCIKEDAAKANIGSPRALSVLSSNTHMIYGISVLSGYDSLYPKSKKMLHDALNYPLEQRKVYGDNALLDVNYSKQALNKALGVNYMILYKDTPPPTGFYPICDDPTDRYQVYRAERRAELVYFAKQTERMVAAEQLERIKSDTVGDGVVLTESIPGETYEPAKVDSYIIKGNSISVRTTQSDPGLLFIGQSFNQGWSATVNGVDANIIKANYDYMAIELPSGNNSVELTFIPRYFAFSTILTLIGIIGLFAMTYHLGIRRRKR